MANEFFKLYTPKRDATEIIRKANSIINTYRAQGLRLTLRQLYYQFVAQDLIPNTEKSYKNLGNVISRARMAGMMDWDAIEDRVRVPKKPPEFNSIHDLVEAAFSSYRLPRLEGQEVYVELWVEKDALAGVLSPIARRYHVTLMVNRGYSSSSAMKESGDRIRERCTHYGIGQAMIFYLGDLDPSGEDMVRDIHERILMFLNEGLLVDMTKVPRGEDIVIESPSDRDKRKPNIIFGIEKLALTMEQVDEYDPPPNPAKMSDSRASAYVEKYGHSSWEVDALPPEVLRDIIEARMEEVLDMDLIEAVKDREEEDKSRLRAALETFSEDNA